MSLFVAFAELSHSLEMRCIAIVYICSTECLLIFLYFTPINLQAKRGKRKGGPVAKTVGKDKASVTLAPEEVHYEGPPAITETLIPTISILTVIGIVPAIASWSRQAWVRYKITSRRIRVTSGIGGKDMAEIVYPDITEMRTVNRLFGDGDMVCFLRDGAKFEMRNIPDFDETLKFILEQVDPDVKENYLKGGDVTRPN